LLQPVAESVNEYIFFRIGSVLSVSVALVGEEVKKLSCAKLSWMDPGTVECVGGPRPVVYKGGNNPGN
jgi:hypothetical protein